MDETSKSAASGTEEAPARRTRNVGTETEAAILDAAIRAFAASGYESVSMRKVAADAGITPPSIYLYYADKRALYVAACIRCFTRTTQRILSAAEQGGTPQQRLAFFVRAMAETLIEDPDTARLFERELIAADREMLAMMERQAFAEPFAVLADLLAEATGRSRSEEDTAGIFAITLGLIQFSEFLETVGRVKLGFSRDPDKLARHVLATIPGLDAEPLPPAAPKTTRRARPR